MVLDPQEGQTLTLWTCENEPVGLSDLLGQPLLLIFLRHLT